MFAPHCYSVTKVTSARRIALHHGELGRGKSASHRAALSDRLSHLTAGQTAAFTAASSVGRELIGDFIPNNRMHNIHHPIKFLDGLD
jgi:hypothetical protein